MNKELEKINEQRIKEDKKQCKLFQVIPQRTSIKPNYITIDSASIVNLTITSGFKKYIDNIEKYQKELWDSNFKTNQKEFKRNGYQFNYMIKTDGIGCSILLVKLKNGEDMGYVELYRYDKVFVKWTSNGDFHSEDDLIKVA